MNYKDYQRSRNAAWQILIDCHVTELPVDLNRILRQLGVGAYTYQENRRLIEKLRLSGIAGATEGLSFYRKGKPVILYDNSLLPYRIRFTIAHEVGHIVLRHISPGDVTKRNHEPDIADSPLETAANQFAARLLAPACVLWGLNIHTADEIGELCHISHQAAEFRAARMAELYKRNRFLLSPLEQAVYKQFEPFIKEYRFRKE